MRSDEWVSEEDPSGPVGPSKEAPAIDRRIDVTETQMARRRRRKRGTCQTNRHQHTHTHTHTHTAERNRQSRDTE